MEGGRERDKAHLEILCQPFPQNTRTKQTPTPTSDSSNLGVHVIPLSQLAVTSKPIVRIEARARRRFKIRKQVCRAGGDELLQILFLLLLLLLLISMPDRLNTRGIRKNPFSEAAGAR